MASTEAAAGRCHNHLSSDMVQGSTQHRDNNASLQPQGYCRVILMIHDVDMRLGSQCITGPWAGYGDISARYASSTASERVFLAAATKATAPRRYSTCVRSGAPFSQSPSSKPQVCRRPRTRAALQRSPHLSEDGRLHPAASVHGPSGLRLLPRKAACCQHDCVGGSKHLEPRSPVGSRRWERLLQDAMPGQQCTQSRAQCKENRCSASVCNCWAGR